MYIIFDRIQGLTVGQYLRLLIRGELTENCNVSQCGMKGGVDAVNDVVWCFMRNLIFGDSRGGNPITLEKGNYKKKVHDSGGEEAQAWKFQVPPPLHPCQMNLWIVSARLMQSSVMLLLVPVMKCILCTCYGKHCSHVSCAYVSYTLIALLNLE